MKNTNLNKITQFDLNLTSNRSLLARIIEEKNGSTIIVGTFKDIWKISFKDKKPTINHLKTLGSNYPNNYFTCLEAWKMKNENYLIVNIHEKMDKNFKTHKFEKKDKNEKKNYIKMFNIDKNDIMNLTDLEKINLNPIFMKEIHVFEEHFLFCYCENPTTFIPETHLMQIKLDKLELTKVSFQVEEFELKNKGFILDMDYVIFDNKIILGFSNIEGNLEIVAYNLFMVEKMEKTFKSENIAFRYVKKLEFPISNLKFFIGEETNTLLLYITSTMGFVFCFNNILEKKLNDGKMQVNEGSKECITYFEIEKYEGKKIMFLFFYDGIISIYTQEKEIYAKWDLLYSEPIANPNMKAFICSKSDDKFIVYITGNLVDIYYIDRFFIN